MESLTFEFQTISEISLTGKGMIHFQCCCVLLKVPWGQVSPRVRRPAPRHQHRIRPLPRDAAHGQVPGGRARGRTPARGLHARAACPVRVRHLHRHCVPPAAILRTPVGLVPLLRHLECNFIKCCFRSDCRYWTFVSMGLYIISKVYTFHPFLNSMMC